MYNDVFNLSFRIYEAKKVTEYEKYINNRASKSEIKDLLAACNFKSEAELKFYFRRIETNKRLLLNEKIFNVKGLNKSSLIKEALHFAIQENNITIFNSVNNDCAYALFAELSVCAWALGECERRQNDPDSNFCNEAWILCLSGAYLIYDECFY
jgi:mRNA-degrading endonuclease HigB of HigAB toxin-antitoxin module